MNREYVFDKDMCVKMYTCVDTSIMTLFFLRFLFYLYNLYTRIFQYMYELDIHV